MYIALMEKQILILIALVMRKINTCKIFSYLKLKNLKDVKGYTVVFRFMEYKRRLNSYWVKDSKKKLV